MRVLLYVPLCVMIVCVGAVVGALLLHVSPAAMVQALSAADTLFALRLSLCTSAGALALALVMGIPSAYLLARRQFPGKVLVDTLLDLPLVMTPLVAGVGLLFLFGQGWLGGALARMGIQVLFTPWGAVVAQTFIATPIVIRTCTAAFEGVDRRYEQAGQTLGLRMDQVFVRITVPLAWQGIVSGAILAWARALGEFGATLMIAGATRFKTATLPISVYLNISSGEIELALACAWLLLLAGFALLLGIKLAGRGRNPGTVTGGPR